MEKAAAALLEGLNANGWVQLTRVVRYMEVYEEIAMRYNGIFRTLMGAALVLALMVPAQGFAQDESDATKRPLGVATGVMVQAYADRFDSLKVSWTQPMALDSQVALDDDDLRGPYTGYRIYYAEEDFSAPDAPVASGVSRVDVGLGVSGIIDGLKPAEKGSMYYVRVAVMNAAGVGPASGGDKAVPGTTEPALAPDRVTGVMVEPGDRMLMVTWGAPFSGHTSLTIKEYGVGYRTSKVGTKDPGTWLWLFVTEESAIVSNLASGTSYDVEVRATNSAGVKGPLSLSMSATTAMGVPTMPEILTFLLAVTLVGAGVYVIRRRSSTGLTPA